MNKKVFVVGFIIGLIGVLLFCSSAFFFGCEEKDNGSRDLTTPVLGVQWVKDFNKLDQLCWQFSVSKSTDWTVRCTYDTGIGLSPNKVVMVEDPDLSKALSKALSQIRTIAGVDSVIIDEIE